jgi:hypothetical protein
MHALAETDLCLDSRFNGNDGDYDYTRSSIHARVSTIRFSSFKNAAE